jgi:hypothetical protein
MSFTSLMCALIGGGSGIARPSAATASGGLPVPTVTSPSLAWDDNVATYAVCDMQAGIVIGTHTGQVLFDGFPSMLARTGVLTVVGDITSWWGQSADTTVDAFSQVTVFASRDGGSTWPYTLVTRSSAPSPNTSGTTSGTWTTTLGGTAVDPSLIKVKVEFITDYEKVGLQIGTAPASANIKEVYFT